MFKFNFLPEPENNTEPEVSSESDPVSGKYDECFEISPTAEQIENTSNQKDGNLNCLTFENVHKIFHVPIDDILDELTEGTDEISCAEKCHSDLVAGVYEGGAKIWECTQDLGEYLFEQKISQKFAHSKVLDLGCGAGILGIIALQNGAEVHFQDYNKAVLQHITIPNVLVNAETESSPTERCRFYSGDWSSYVTKTKQDNGTFDFILTSETIYNIQNYVKIIDVLKNKLKPNGVCYLAAKSHYFGVGGSLRSFESALLTKSDQFESTSVFVSNENVSREILKISFKKTE